MKILEKINYLSVLKWIFILVGLGFFGYVFTLSTGCNPIFIIAGIVVMGLLNLPAVNTHNQPQNKEGLEIVTGRTRKFQSCEEARAVAINLAEKETLRRKKLGIK